jgi:hypothetical protein
VWQASHVLLLAMCVAFFPVALVPLWQLAQFVVMPVWSNFAGFHALGLWQSSHVLLLAMCPVFLPVAIVPLWHEKQLPTTCV